MTDQDQLAKLYANAMAEAEDLRERLRLMRKVAVMLLAHAEHGLKAGPVPGWLIDAREDITKAGR